MLADRGGLNRRRSGDEHFERLVFPGESESWSVQSLFEAPDGVLNAMIEAVGRNVSTA